MSDLFGWLATHPGMLARATEQHLNLSLVALAAVLALGLPGGIGLARHPRLSGPVLAIVNTLRTIPSLALLVLMLPFLGTGFLPSVVALVLYGLPAVLINAVSGIASVDPDIEDAARGQGLSERQILFGISLPLAIPVILAGIRTSAVQIVSGATLAVFIGGGGLGELISSGMGLLDLNMLIVGALAVALLAVATEIVLGIAERVLVRLYGVSP